MVRLDKPVRKSITGNTTGTDLLTVGSDPLPNNDNAVTPILFGLDISTDGAANIQIISGTTYLYDKKFSAAGVDRVTNVIRKGGPTNDAVIVVSGAAGGNVVRIVADVGFEYNGGARID